MIRKIVTERPCASCGVLFGVRSDKITTAKCCSRKCLYQLQRIGNDISCKTCGNYVYQRISVGNEFCSKRCFYDSGSPKLNARKLRIPFSCIICDKITEVLPSRIKTNPKYCSHKCNAIGQLLKTHDRSSKERDFEELLILNNIQFQYSFVIDQKIFDFFIPHKNTLIEIDGIFWHSKNFWENNIEFEDLYEVQRRVIKNDLIKNEIAKIHNFELIRVWETDITSFNFTILL